MQVGQSYKIIAEVYTLAERIETKLVIANTTRNKKFLCV